MRARNIKPSFFTNLELGECDPLARLLFIGLWCIADREGRLEDKPKQIKIQTIPYDDVDCDSLLKQLNDNNFIYRYIHGGKAYIQINNFLKHQNPHIKEKESEIPGPYSTDSQPIDNKEEIQEPEKHQTSQVQNQEKHQTIPADSLLLNPDSLNLNPEDNTPIVNDSPKPKKSNRGTRLPDDFKMPNDWLRIGKDLRPELHSTEIKLASDSFIDYWHSAAGAKACKADWLATWRNWIRSHRPLSNIRQFPDKKLVMQANTSHVNYREGVRIGPDGEYLF